MSAQPASSPFLPSATPEVTQQNAQAPLQVANQNSGYELLMQIEAQARECTSLEELHHLIATQTKKLVPARQIFVFDCERGAKICAISNLPKVDRSVPLVHELEQTIGYLQSGDELLKPRDFDIPTSGASGNNTLETYPFRKLLWVPLLSRSGTLGSGMLLSSEQSWSENNIATVTRLASTFSHAKALLVSEQNPKARKSARSLFNRWTLGAAAIVLFAASWIPVSMTTLAPFEVSSRKPFVIAASIDGVLEEVLVEPGEHVEKGDALLRFQNTMLGNKQSVAEKEVQLAQARVKRANQLAFDSQEGREELGVAKAELFVKQAQLKLAKEQAAHTVIHAPTPGVAVLADTQSLTGKPVKVGQQIMQIADPNDLRIAIRLPVKDSIALEEGSRVKLFLDSDPLNARTATIEYIDYQATQTNGSGLSYRITAKLDDDGGRTPRLGVQGTAHLEGRTVPIIMYVLRRPLTAARQWLGI